MQKNRYGDVGAFVFVLAIVAYLTICSDQFTSLTREHPYLMGFAKFALLAPFGRLLAMRLFRTRRWEVSGLLIPQALLWGLTGMWITAAFALFASGTAGLMNAALWPQATGVALALSRSLWINVLGGFGFTMMLTHEVAERWVCARVSGHFLSLRSIFETLGRDNWFVPILITVFLWWVPAHTVTFLLPQSWQILFAASLSVVLGLIKALIARPVQG